MLALYKHGCDLKHVPTEDKEEPAVLAAVEQCGLALEYVPRDLRNNGDIVLAAVSQAKSASEFASTELKSDPEIQQLAEQLAGT